MTKPKTVADDARDRAGQTLADGKPIMDRALLLRCAEELDRLQAALREIGDQAQKRGGIWAGQRADAALDR